MSLEGKNDPKKVIAQVYARYTQQGSDLKRFLETSSAPTIERARVSESDEIKFIDYKPPAIKSKRNCPNCKGNNVIRAVVGGRSGDELAPVGFMCNDCGETWRH